MYLGQLRAWPTLRAEKAVTSAVPEFLLSAVPRLTGHSTRLETKGVTMLSSSTFLIQFARKEDLQCLGI
jgi:hypothetical protein